jgi:hypothetical protein|tara:strand:+ start:4256 stop:5371 length:1116 start_codon:yes stop_codon:yes gene_type:complete
MAKRVYFENIRRYSNSLGATAIGSLGALLLLYLAAIGAIEITGNSGDSTCSGQAPDLCYAYINISVKEDIFVYPEDYDPWGRNTPMMFEPAVDAWYLQRRWGKGWRTYPLHETCKGTWCGGKYGLTNNKYSFALRKGKDYQLRIVAVKKNPEDDIKWGFGDLDPTWFGIQGEVGRSVEGKSAYYEKAGYGRIEQTPLNAYGLKAPLSLNITSQFSDYSVNVTFGGEGVYIKDIFIFKTIKVPRYNKSNYHQFQCPTDVIINGDIATCTAGGISYNYTYHRVENNRIYFDNGGHFQFLEGFDSKLGWEEINSLPIEDVSDSQILLNFTFRKKGAIEENQIPYVITLQDQHTSRKVSLTGNIIYQDHKGESVR